MKLLYFGAHILINVWNLHNAAILRLNTTVTKGILAFPTLRYVVIQGKLGALLRMLASQEIAVTLLQPLTAQKEIHVQLKRIAVLTSLKRRNANFKMGMTFA